MKNRAAEGIIIQPAGPRLPKTGRLTAKVRQALANYDSMMHELEAPTITAEYRRATSALDYILRVLSPAELTAYYQAVRERRER